MLKHGMQLRSEVPLTCDATNGASPDFRRAGVNKKAGDCSQALGSINDYY